MTRIIKEDLEKAPDIKLSKRESEEHSLVQEEFSTLIPEWLESTNLTKTTRREVLTPEKHVSNILKII